MQEKSTLYSFAIIAQPIHQEKRKNYLWQRQGKYKRLEDAEKAIERFTKTTLTTAIYRIVPYFECYWWTDEETRKGGFIETNGLLWDYLNKKGLADDAREFLSLSDRQRKKRCFF
jgi:hypothetical protein